jgi:hypothetical protein
LYSNICSLGAPKGAAAAVAAGAAWTGAAAVGLNWAVLPAKGVGEVVSSSAPKESPLDKRQNVSKSCK